MRWTLLAAKAAYYPQVFRWPAGSESWRWICRLSMLAAACAAASPVTVGVRILLVLGAFAAAEWAFRKGARGVRRGIRLDREGLVELFWRRRPRTLVYDDLVEVGRPTASGFTITTRDQPVYVDSDVVGWLRMYSELLLRRATDRPTDPSRLITHEELGALLGVTQGSQLVLRHSDNKDSAANSLACCVLSIAMAVFCEMDARQRTTVGGWLPPVFGGVRDAFGMRVGAVAFLCYAALLGRQAVRSRRRLVVGAHGLQDLGCWTWRSYSWERVCGVQKAGGHLTILTEDGSIGLPQKNELARKVFAAATSVVDARRRGRIFDTEWIASDAAISRATGTDAREDQALGLSRSASGES